MTRLSLHVPAEHRPDLLEVCENICENIDAEEIGADTRDIDGLVSQLTSSPSGTVTAPPALLWRVLTWAMGIAGDEISALCQAMHAPREDIEATMRAVAWYLDALDVVGSLDFEPVA